MKKHRKHGGGGDHGGGGGGHNGGGLRWLVTYADMITLLMAFFIMMYSMSVMNLQKFNEVAFSIRSGFGGLLTGKGVHLLSETEGKRVLHIRNLPDHSAESIETKMNSYILLKDLQKDVQVYPDSRGMVISMAAENLLFARGSAVMAPASRVLLDQVAGLVKNYANDIQVEGHTCNLPIATTQFPTNWELSAARASTVTRFLTEHGVPAGKLSAVGYADTRPLVPNDTEAHRMRNRRVDIVLLDRMYTAVHGPREAAAVAQKPVTPQQDDGTTTSIRPSLRPSLQTIGE
jgi:chemotaxis protein MotB